jgi:hypothetical protein
MFLEIQKRMEFGYLGGFEPWYLVVLVFGDDR